MQRLDDFMREANAAYYAHHDPFADFITAPEISQAFGELLGLWAATVWVEMGSPAPVVLAECGPGRATLMRDALRAIGQAMPAFGQALRLHLVENSPRLRAIQRQHLPVAGFHNDCADLPAGPMILLANEFLDALPIRQLIRRGQSWLERGVAAGRVVEMPGRAMASPLDDHRHDAGPLDETVAEGTIREINEAAGDVIAGLARRFAVTPGVALFIDYGPAASGFGDTLQALRGGQPADPFAEPGSADLTAHVDFAALIAVARMAGAAGCGPLPQGEFLTRLGLFPRLHRLARGQPPAAAMAMLRAGARLAEPEQMGSLFKAMAICHPGLSPPGFSA